jgi:hypothetical protein
MSPSSSDHARRVSEGAYARLTPEHRSRRARAAALSRHGSELAADERAALKADALERHIRQMVDAWPPLTSAQRGRLAALLGGAGEGADDEAP